LATEAIEIGFFAFQNNADMLFSGTPCIVTVVPFGIENFYELGKAGQTSRWKK
jgi:hypothetical protein